MDSRDERLEHASPHEVLEHAEHFVREPRGWKRIRKEYSPTEFRDTYKMLKTRIPDVFLQTLGKVKEIDDSTKDDILPVLKDHLDRMMPTYAIRGILAIVYRKMPKDYYFIGIPLALIVFLAVLSSLAWPRLDGWRMVLSAAVGLLVLALQCFLSVTLVARLRRYVPRFFRSSDDRVPVLVPMVLVWVVLAQYAGLSRLPDWLVIALQSASWAVAAFLAGLIVVLQGLVVAFLLLQRSEILKSPDAALTVTVLDMLFVLQETQKKWGTDPEVAKSVSQGLGGLADLIERAGRHKVGQMEELMTEARSISAAVRKLRRNVVLGGVKGFKTGQQALASMLLPLARGDWTSLEHADAAPVTAHWAFRLLLRILNTVAIAALPYIALVALRSDVIPIANADAMAKQLDVIAAWWVVAVVLTTLQPKSTEIAGVAGKLAGKSP